MPRPKKWHPGHITVIAKCNAELADEIDTARALLIVDACDDGTRCMNRGEFARASMKWLGLLLCDGVVYPEEFKGLLEGEATVREVRGWEKENKP